LVQTAAFPNQFTRHQDASARRSLLADDLGAHLLDAYLPRAAVRFDRLCSAHALLASPISADNSGLNRTGDAAFEVGYRHIMAARITAPGEQNRPSSNGALQSPGADFAASTALFGEMQPQPLIRQ
jgi:hypothetical protein